MFDPILLLLPPPTLLPHAIFTIPLSSFPHPLSLSEHSFLALKSFPLTSLTNYQPFVSLSLYALLNVPIATSITHLVYFQVAFSFSHHT